MKQALVCLLSMLLLASCQRRNSFRQEANTDIGDRGYKLEHGTAQDAGADKSLRTRTHVAYAGHASP